MSRDNSEEVNILVDHLFRSQYGKMVSVLASVFGFHHLQIAEDLVQDTLMEAYRNWSYGKVPEKPEAWLMQVAKNKALNYLKREKNRRNIYSQIAPGAESSGELEHHFLDAEIADSQLRMIFACCHPSIGKPDQIALVLKTLCGFGNREIARALLLGDEAINKRLYRARKEIQKGEISLEVPSGEALKHRLEVVCTCLYLLFNEGYHANHQDEPIRKDLCLEAMRLTRLLTGHFPEHPPVFALMALMCFHAARFDSRVDEQGALVIFAEQDRHSWDKDLIQSGLFYLSKAAKGEVLSTYHLEASIAAQHCQAEDFASTNWAFIQTLYGKLYELSPSPIILLNLAIIEGVTLGPAKAIQQLLPLIKDKKMANYPLLHASLGEFYQQLGETAEAKSCFELALNLSLSGAEQELIRKKIGVLELSARN